MSMNLLYSIREGVLGLRRARVATFLTISTIVITLTLLGVFLVVTYNIAELVNRFKQNISFEVFVDAGLDSQEIQNLKQQIQSVEGIHEVIYVSKEAALERYRNELGMDPLLILEENPLPASFQIRLISEKRNRSGAERAIQKIRPMHGVEDIVYHGRLMDILDKVGKYILLVDLGLGILVFLSVILLVSNTLRLTILSQQKNIQIMELVGATKGFIRRPYIVQGMLQGGIGGTIAALFLFGMVKLFSMRFPNTLQLSVFMFLLPIVMGLFLSLFGIGIGVKRFLRGS